MLYLSKYSIANIYLNIPITTENSRDCGQRLKNRPTRLRCNSNLTKGIVFAMASFSSFLNPGNQPSIPASNPIVNPSLLSPASQQTGATPTDQTQQQPNVLPPPSLSSIQGISSFTSVSSGSSAATVRLREIAQQSQKLNETIRAGSAELPKLELSLGMIREKARDMSRRAGGAGRENMQQAYPSPNSLA